MLDGATLQFLPCAMCAPARGGRDGGGRGRRVCRLPARRLICRAWPVVDSPVTGALRLEGKSEICRASTEPFVALPDRFAPAVRSGLPFPFQFLPRRVRQVPTLPRTAARVLLRARDHDVEQALTKVMSQLDRLCTNADADQVVSRLLRQFDVVTGLSAWTDPRQIQLTRSLSTLRSDLDAVVRAALDAVDAGALVRARARRRRSSSRRCNRAAAVDVIAAGKAARSDADAFASRRAARAAARYRARPARRPVCRQAPSGTTAGIRCRPPAASRRARRALAIAAAIARATTCCWCCCRAAARR